MPHTPSPCLGEGTAVNAWRHGLNSLATFLDAEEASFVLCKSGWDGWNTRWNAIIFQASFHIYTDFLASVENSRVDYQQATTWNVRHPHKMRVKHDILGKYQQLVPPYQGGVHANAPRLHSIFVSLLWWQPEWKPGLYISPFTMPIPRRPLANLIFLNKSCLMPACHSLDP